MFAKRGREGNREQRIAAIIELLKRYAAEGWTQQQWDGVWAQYDYSEGEYRAALQGYQALGQLNRSRRVVADPLRFVSAGEEPNSTLSSQLHQQGLLIAKVAIQFRCSIEYVPDESRRSLRITRFVFRCVLPADPNQKPTNASAIEGLLENFVLYASLHPNSSVVVLPGRVEIHQPINSDDWVRPAFKRYVQTGLKVEGGAKQFHSAKNFSLHQSVDMQLHKDADGEVTEVPADGLRYVMGVDLDDRPMLSEKFIGLLISGTTGSGKSQHLLSLLNQLMIRHHPKYLQVSLIDICGKTFFPYKESPHLFHAPILAPSETDLTRSYAEINKELNDRDKMFTENGIYDIESWNDRFPDKPVPRIVIMVEEHAETVTVMGRDLVNGTLTRVGRIGRKLGVTLVICTQYVQIDDFKFGDQKSLLRNLGHRVVFKAADAVGSGNGFGNSSLTCATTLQGGGDGFTIRAGIPVRFQSLYLGDDRGVRIAQAILHHTAIKYPEFMAAKQVEPDDDFWGAETSAVEPVSQPKERSDLSDAVICQAWSDLPKTLTKTETVRAIFPDAHTLPPEKLVGNTLNKYWNRLQSALEAEGLKNA